MKASIHRKMSWVIWNLQTKTKKLKLHLQDKKNPVKSTKKDRLKFTKTTRKRFTRVIMLM